MRSLLCAALTCIVHHTRISLLASVDDMKPSAFTLETSGGGQSQAMYFPWCVNLMSNHLEENHLLVDPPSNIPLQTGNLSSSAFWQGACSPLSGGVDSESAFCGTSFSLDTAPDDLAVRVLRNSVASAPFSSVTLGSGWGLANALWTDAQRPGDRGQLRDDASCRNTLDTSSGEPSVAGSDVEHAPTVPCRPSLAGTV